MNRRAFFATAALAASFFAGRAAWSGSYLDRAALMLDEGRKEADAVKSRTGDKETLLVVKAMTEARVKVARKMNVPAAVVDAHPHLLLVLENYDRALDALIANNQRKFAECLVTAAAEERTFRNLLTQLGYALPKL
jgi:hypothetical protein